MTEEEYNITKREDIIIKNKEVKEEVKEEKESTQPQNNFYNSPIYPDEKIKPVKQNVSNYENVDKIKKQNIKEFNENPTTKEHGVKLINKTTYTILLIFAGLFFLLLLTNMIWHNSILGKFVKKDFNPIINNNIQPANVSVPVEVTNTNTNNYYNNYTIINNNTIILPGEIAITLLNNS